MNVSLVIPVFNEEGNLHLLWDSINHVFADFTATWEVIFVDDGSLDNSISILEEIAEGNPDHARVIEFRRNFGQTAAIAAGIDHAVGDTIVLLDADMQNDPADIPLLLEKIESGYDVVSGWRHDRKDKLVTRKLPSRFANKLISLVTGVHLHDYGCTLKAYRKEVIKNFKLYGEMHRFIPAYAGAVGAKILEVPVRHHPRKHGQTKYGLERTLKVVLDLFTVKFLLSYAAKPIYLFGGTGLGLIIISSLTLLYLLIRRLWIGTAVLTSPIFTTSLVFLIMGFQSILMGLIAELLVRTYHEAQHKPTYTIRKRINVESRKEG